MRAYLLSGALVLALAACVSHPSRCGHRLSPINPQSIRRGFNVQPRPRGAHGIEAAQS